jgi:hypothetical protein
MSKSASARCETFSPETRLKAPTDDESADRPARSCSRPWPGSGHRGHKSPAKGLVMEPTGIEPVTSCLQSDTAHPLYGPQFRRLRGIAAPARPRGYGGIRRDPAGFGQRNRAAAQTIAVRLGRTHRCLYRPASPSTRSALACFDLHGFFVGNCLFGGEAHLFFGLTRQRRVKVSFGCPRSCSGACTPFAALHVAFAVVAILSIAVIGAIAEQVTDTVASPHLNDVPGPIPMSASQAAVGVARDDDADRWTTNAEIVTAACVA